MHPLQALKKNGAKPTGCAGKRRTILFLLILSLGLAGCKSNPAPTGNGSNQSSNTTTPATSTTPAPTPPAQAIAFDGGRAYEHVRKQVEIGPRPAGSTELA